MTISRPCYITRERVMRAIDIKYSARYSDSVDRAIESSSEDIDHVCHRRFYNVDESKHWDWPNFQRAYPWRLWFDESDIADVTVNVPQVYTGAGGNSTPRLISAQSIFWGPYNYAPPYTYLELDRSSNASFGYSMTPQRDISIAATFGYWLKTQAAGTLAAAITTTSQSTITVSSSFQPGVGDVIYIGTERMLVTDRSMVTTGQTQQGAGCSTTSAADATLAVTDGTKYSINETVLLDAERMLIVDIVGNNLIVKRGFDGTTLATHTGATIYAARLLNVTRGDFGTIASVYLNGTALSVGIPPASVRDFALAASIVQIMQELGGFADRPGEGVQVGNQLVTHRSSPAVGTGLGSLRVDLVSHHGRKGRSRVV